MLLEGLAESGDIGGWQERQAKHQMSLLDLQEKQRAMADAQKLRELYASNPNASFSEAAAIDPAFAQKMQQFNNEQMLRQFQILESQGKIEENQRKTKEAKQHTFANTLGPLIENWQESLGGKQPTAQDLETFKGRLGGALKFLDETYGYKPDVPIDPYHPEQVLGTAESLGYASRRAKTSQEAQLRNLPPQMSSGQYYGEQHVTPEGYAVRTPGMGGQPPARMPQRPMQIPAQAPTTQEDVTEPQLQAYIASLPEGPDKQRLMSVISRGQSMAPGSSSTVEVTPEELARIRKFNEAEKAKAVETAKLEANKEQTVKQREEILSSIPARSEIESLIDKSIASGIEQQVKGKLGPAVGVSSDALSATKQLDVIAPQLKSITKSLAGAGAISDFEQKMMADAAGAIADPNVPADARKAAFRTFMDIMDKADKSAKPAQGGLPRPATAAEARALPKGTQFIDPNGVVRINE